MDPVENIKMKDKRRRTNQQVFYLADDTESIRVCLWGKDTEQARNVSVGDLVRVSNVKSNVFRGTVSLDSTASTKIGKVAQTSLFF